MMPDTSCPDLYLLWYEEHGEITLHVFENKEDYLDAQDECADDDIICHTLSLNFHPAT
jgi:hypothetical protein